MDDGMDVDLRESSIFFFCVFGNGVGLMVGSNVEGFCVRVTTWLVFWDSWVWILGLLGRGRRGRKKGVMYGDGEKRYVHCRRE